METRTIRTEAGNLELVPASIDQLRGIARCWPMELLGNPEHPGHFGLVFQRGDRQIQGIKLQPVDIDERDAMISHHVNRALIAAALPYYLEYNHQGVMVPCAYYKEKGNGLAESGIAFFVGPDAASRSRPVKGEEPIYDDDLGPGATPMVFDMAGALAKASKKNKLPMATVIGMDIRPRPALGGLAMHFVVAGPQVFVVKHPLEDDEPVWKHVVGASFSTLPYAPMQTLALPGPSPADTPHA